MELLNLSIFILFMVLLGAFVFDSIRLRLLNKKIANQNIQAEVDKAVLANKLNKIILEHSAEKSDGFLRFVSDSREQAFKYIEDVQEAIKAFDDEIGPIVKHYKKTGKSLTRKQSEILKKLDMSYDIIMTLMPEEDKNV